MSAPNGWGRRDGDVTHVWPLDDLREHERSAGCWCRPEVEEDGLLVIHNSMDRREEFESDGTRKPS